MKGKKSLEGREGVENYLGRMDFEIWKVVISGRRRNSKDHQACFRGRGVRRNRLGL